jgi:hypothetical protein
VTDGHSAGGTDRYEQDDARHIDEFPPYNGDRIAEWAYDDEGNRFKVKSGDRLPATYFIAEERWRENVLPDRDGVGETCVGCGETIEWDAIIVNSEYHVRCYVEWGTDRSDGGADS